MIRGWWGSGFNITLCLSGTHVLTVAWEGSSFLLTNLVVDLKPACWKIGTLLNEDWTCLEFNSIYIVTLNRLGVVLHQTNHNEWSLKASTIPLQQPITEGNQLVVFRNIFFWNLFLNFWCLDIWLWRLIQGCNVYKIWWNWDQ